MSKLNGTCKFYNSAKGFGFLIEKALSLGADCVATGHYVINKKGRLFESKDKEKDQTYFLCQLNDWCPDGCRERCALIRAV